MSTSYKAMANCYNLFLKKKWEELESFYLRNDLVISLPHTVFKDTAIHLAVYSGNKNLVEALLKVVYEEHRDRFLGEDPDNEIFRTRNKFGNTPLHEAASTGNTAIVDIIMKYDRKQLITKNDEGETPLFMAAVYGRTDVIKYLVTEVEEDSKMNSERDIKYHMRSNTTSILHEAIRGYHFETALELLNLPEHQILEAVGKDENDLTCFQLLADNPKAFESGNSYGIWEKLICHCLPVHDYSIKDEKNTVYQPRSSPNSDEERGQTDYPSRNVCQFFSTPAFQIINVANWYSNFWKQIAKGFPSIEEIWDIKKNQRIAVKLAQRLAREDKSWQENNNDRQNDIPLFAAAKFGIIEIVKAILEVSPQAIEYENHKKENIFHVAVEHRRINVLHYLLQYCYISDSRLMWRINEHGDSILHQAAYNKGFSSRERPGEALRLQSDIQWFERVKETVPPHLENQVNNRKLTPQDLFTKEHKDLVKNGQKWLLRTTNSCIIVAVLIATVAFTGIYTVPGGSDKKSGKPFFIKKEVFAVYTASDVASLCFAFTSVVVFLSISTSKMNEQDFRRSLPLKLVLGLSMLFWSVVALMSSFAAALVITMSQKLDQASTVPIITIACFPAAFFLLLQVPLYINITWFTIKDLFRSLIAFIPHNKFCCTVHALERCRLALRRP